MEVNYKSEMTKEEYDILEKLLSKLGNQLPRNKYCIIPGYLQDGYHIGIYAANGDRIAQQIGPTIESTIKLFKKP